MIDRRITHTPVEPPAETIQLNVAQLKSEVYSLARSKRDVVALEKAGLMGTLSDRASRVIPGASIVYDGAESFTMTLPYVRGGRNRPSDLAKILDEAVQEAYDLLILDTAA